MNLKPFLVPAVLIAASVASAQLRLTELMYDGADGEIIEITNFGTTAVDLTGWSLDDNDGGSIPEQEIDLSSLGTIAPNETFVVTDETDADTFRAQWNLPSTVKVLTKVDPGYGRNDRVELYNSSDVLQFRFAYGDQDFPGTTRAQNVSVNVPLAEIDLLSTEGDSVGTVASAIGDSYGSYASTVTGNIGNPGIYTPVASVPEPASMAALAVGGLALLRRRKKA